MDRLKTVRAGLFDRPVPSLVEGLRANGMYGPDQYGNARS